MVTTYCKPQSVIDLLQLQSEDGTDRYTLDEESDPEFSEMERFINAAEDRMDKYTRTAWRSKTITDKYYPSKPPQRLRIYGITGRVVKIRLTYRDIKDLDNSSFNDKIEIFNGTTWNDLLVTGTEGNGMFNGDFWLDQQDGILYLFNSWPIWGGKNIRLSFRYGKTVITEDVAKACRYFAGINVLHSGFYTRHFPSNTAEQKPSELAKEFERLGKETLQEYREVRYV